jgi:RNA polymerase sigma-70 factor (ECF subfamily)
MTSSDGFDEFYQSAFGRLVGQVYLVTGDLGDAEDAVQEAFARASARWSKLRDFNVPEQWVRRVATNLALDGLRRARRRLAAFARLGPSPAVAPISVERVALADALRTLPRGYRQVIVPHHLLELPVGAGGAGAWDPDRDGQGQALPGPPRTGQMAGSSGGGGGNQRWISWGQSWPGWPRRQPPGPVPRGRQRPGGAARVVVATRPPRRCC